MEIAIITTPRDPSYIEDTILRLGHMNAYDMPLMRAFSDDPTYYVEGAGIPTRHMPRALQMIANDVGRGAKRACLNFLHALLSGFGDIMLFEDDIDVKPEWLDRLRTILLAHPSDLISLYWPDESVLEDPEEELTGFPTRRYRKPEQFHGSLGLFVPGRHRFSLASFLVDRVYDARNEPGHLLMPFDNMVSHWLLQVPHVDLVATVPALVNHRGEVSAIPENASHGPRHSPGW